MVSTVKASYVNLFLQFLVQVMMDLHNANKEKAGEKQKKNNNLQLLERSQFVSRKKKMMQLCELRRVMAWKNNQNLVISFILVK
jgi:hypothetical protein